MYSDYLRLCVDDLHLRNYTSMRLLARPCPSLFSGDRAHELLNPGSLSVPLSAIHDG